MNNQISICQEISDLINKEYNPQFYAAPGVDRIGKMANKHEVTVINDNGLQFKIYPSQNYNQIEVNNYGNESITNVQDITQKLALTTAKVTKKYL